MTGRLARNLGTRVTEETGARFDHMAHRLGYSAPSQLLRVVVEVFIALDDDEVPDLYRAGALASEETEYPLMKPVVSREEVLPGESVESLIHRLFSEKKTDRESDQRRRMDGLGE